MLIDIIHNSKIISFSVISILHSEEPLVGDVVLYFTMFHGLEIWVYFVVQL